jgi:hypothetical protein
MFERDASLPETGEGVAMKRPAILVDIDGTIALRGTREPHDHDASMEDAVNWPVVKIIDALYQSGNWHIVFLSGRQEKYREVTEYWIWRHNLVGDWPVPTLFMRATGDQRKDDIVKRELYDTYVAPHYDVQVVFDDRNTVVKMWRELGLTCFQVAEGDF